MALLLQRIVPHDPPLPVLPEKANFRQRAALWIAKSLRVRLEFEERGLARRKLTPDLAEKKEPDSQPGG